MDGSEKAGQDFFLTFRKFDGGAEDIGGHGYPAVLGHAQAEIDDAALAVLPHGRSHEFQPLVSPESGKIFLERQ